MTTSMPDLNATPANGTGNGEDDEARTDLRTSAGSSDVFVSPNPNEVPPQSNEADLSLLMQSSSRALTVGQVVSFTLTVTNRGAMTATNIGLRDKLPANLKFVISVSGMNANRNLISVGLSEILPGKSMSVEFTARVINPGLFTNQAQIDYTNQPDFDSKPNNGYLNREDDRASNELRTIEN